MKSGDFIDIVRCGDCVYCEAEGATRLKHICRKTNLTTRKDGYCHMGSKRKSFSENSDRQKVKTKDAVAFAESVIGALYKRNENDATSFVSDLKIVCGELAACLQRNEDIPERNEEFPF